MTRMKKRKSDISLIIFDLDGTLVDTTLAIVLNYTHLFDKYNLPIPSLKDMIYFSGPPLTDIFRDYYPGIPMEDLLKEYGDYSRKYANHYSKLFDDEIEVLSALKEAGYELAILSNKKRVAVEANLAYFDLAKYFSTVVCLDDQPYPKPDSRSVKEVLRRGSYHLESENIFLIGDSRFDIECGKPLGIKGGLCLFGLKKEDNVEASETYQTFKDIERSFVIHD